MTGFLKSGLYTGTVTHARTEPSHSFSYPIFLTYLDLDEVEDVLSHHPLWSTHPMSPVQFRRSDYLGDPSVPLSDAVRDIVEKETGERPQGSIRMLGHLRTFWWLFNPITLYYCFDRHDDLCAVVAEVTSTPWHERHSYVVPARSARGGHLVPKRLHVSPFMGMDQFYDFRVGEPANGATVDIDTYESGSRVLSVSLRLEREEVSRRALGSILWRYPFQTLRVSAAIYAQAAHLRRSGAPFHAHPRRGTLAPEEAVGNTFECAGLDSGAKLRAVGIADLARTTAGRSTLPVARGARFVIRRMLKGLRRGALMIEESGTRTRYGDQSVTPAEIVVRDPRAWQAVVSEGSVGLGRGYIHGWWDSPDPVAVLRVLTRNLEWLDRVNAATDRRLGPLLDRMRRRRLGRPSRRRDRENVRAHYDLGNEFFELMLDDTMSYSCAVFADEDTPLVDASIAKLDRICRLLDLGPDDHLLEIGTGWGGLATFAAERFGCQVTTTTVSAEQYDRARKRVAEAGLTDRVEVLDLDYRALEGSFDKVVSVEMIEAVDWREHDLFFQTCDRLLRPGGRMVLQAITIPDDRFDLRKNRTDFIKHFIFPGGCLPSRAAIAESVRRTSDLEVTDLDEIGPHYVQTLRCWRRNLDDAEDAVRALGLDERFSRMWGLYLAFCEAGFSEGHIGVVQMVLERQGRADAHAP